MRALFRLVLFGMIGMICLIAYYVSTSTTWTWHTQLDVTVMTPEGRKTGSIIYREALTRTSGALVPAEAAGASRQLWGEAAALEVTPGRYLFILLADLPSALDYTDVEQKPIELAAHLQDVVSMAPVTLPAQAYPKLATFEALDDPTTAIEITPRNISAVFGDGISVLSVSLRVTKASLTLGQTETLLPWLSEYHDKMLDGRTYQTVRTTNPFAIALLPSPFVPRERLHAGGSGVTSDASKVVCLGRKQPLL